MVITSRENGCCEEVNVENSLIFGKKSFVLLGIEVSRSLPYVVNGRERG